MIDVLKMNRPSFDEYFINIAYAVSARSEDEFIKHGCVIVHDHSKHIIGTGYNALIRGMAEETVDRHDRDGRRKYMIHSEENAILNSTKHPLEIGSCTAYITALPCNNCLQRIINFGIYRIVYHMDDSCIGINDEEQVLVRNKLLSCTKYGQVKLERIPFFKKIVFIDD